MRSRNCRENNFCNCPLRIHNWYLWILVFRWTQQKRFIHIDKITHWLFSPYHIAAGIARGLKQCCFCLGNINKRKWQTIRNLYYDFGAYIEFPNIGELKNSVNFNRYRISSAYLNVPSGVKIHERETFNAGLLSWGGKKWPRQLDGRNRDCFHFDWIAWLVCEVELIRKKSHISRRRWFNYHFWPETLITKQEQN